jgi:hypothetical protein
MTSAMYAKAAGAWKQVYPPVIPFDPSQLSGLQLWLDADKSGAVTPSSGTVTSWLDRGPLALDFNSLVPINHTDPGQTWSRPIVGTLNGRKAVQFNGLQGLSIAPSGPKMFVAHSPLLRKATGVTAFSAFAATDLSFGNRMFGIGVGSAGGGTTQDGPYGTVGLNAGRYRVCLGPGSTTGYGLTYRVIDEVVGSNFVGTRAPTTSDRVARTVLNYSAGTQRAYIDGSLVTEVTGLASSAASSDTDSDYAFVGMWNFSNDPSTSGFCGVLGEVIVYNRVLETWEIDKVEAYLNKRWKP